MKYIQMKSYIRFADFLSPIPLFLTDLGGQDKSSFPLFPVTILFDEDRIYGVLREHTILVFMFERQYCNDQKD